MKFLWVDTETTGLKPDNAAPFQIAMIFVSSNKNIKEESERIFYLNPFDIPGIEYNEDAGKVHGYKESVIRTFEPSKLVVPKIDQALQDFFNFREPEQMFFCGYNGEFDYDHLTQLFMKNGYDFEKYFNKNHLDVFKQVKAASAKGVIPRLENLKLVTVAKYLHVDLNNAHDAMGDIKATREVAKSLSMQGISLS